MAKRPPVVAQKRFNQHREQLEHLELGELFSAIYNLNLWDAQTSKSGLGSELKSIKPLAEALPKLCATLNAETVVDAPCGDGNWITTLDLKHKRYIGLDIVPALIDNLAHRFASDATREYRIVDITKGPIPHGDLIICRDCLVHLSHANIQRTIAQFKSSGSTWLLTTHFTDIDQNDDITDGDWRALNLCRGPFSWPAPEFICDEKCEEMDGAYRDKCLALWRIADLPDIGEE